MLFKFDPIFKSTIWGGDRLASLKNIEAPQPLIGESWELSAVPGDESYVSGGPDDGLSLSQLVSKYGADILGKKVFDKFGTRFPLLIKFIDARQDLSIQVHPDDELAAARHDGSRGKTEMWYVLDSEPDAHLMSGFKTPLTPDEYKAAVADNSIVSHLADYKVKEGDVFYLPAGRVHAIGTGCLIAEIQETSDITYRIYDYDRRDAEGNPRQLHTDLAADAIDFSVQDDYRTHYTPEKDTPVTLVSCPYFTTQLLDLDRPVEIPVSANDSFMVIMALEGTVNVKGTDSETTLSRGHTLLVSASEDFVRLSPSPRAKLLLSFC